MIARKDMMEFKKMCSKTCDDEFFMCDYEEKAEKEKQLAKDNIEGKLVLMLKKKLGLAIVKRFRKKSFKPLTLQDAL